MSVKMTGVGEAIWWSAMCPRLAPGDQGSRTDGPPNSWSGTLNKFLTCSGHQFFHQQNEGVRLDCRFNLNKTKHQKKTQQESFLKIKSHADLQCIKADKNGTTLTKGTLPQPHLQPFALPPAHWSETLLIKILHGSMLWELPVRSRKKKKRLAG